MREILNKVFDGEILENKDIERVLDLIEKDEANHAQIAALLGAIAARGVSPFELAGFAKYLRAKSPKLELEGKNFIDVCGTGGDCAGTFNISTAVAFVAASFGLKVIKHGGRSVSSKCGSADVLEELGVCINLPAHKIQDALDQCNMVFLYAPDYNPFMAKLRPLRAAVGAPTIFNLLGPLVNPVNLDYQVMGVYEGKLCKTIAGSLSEIGVKSAMVVHGADGLDEITTTADNVICEMKNGNVQKYDLPLLDELGIKKAKIGDLKGGDRRENALIVLDILKGRENGAKTDIVALNSAAALVTAGIAKDFYEGVALAKNALKSGAALDILERLKNVS